MSRTVAIVAAAAALLAAAASASAADQVVLENGLTVILAPRRGAPAVQAAVFVKVGMRHERPEEAGASHFVEHLMFRSTAKRKTGDIDREAWRVGGSAKATTNEEYTEYRAFVPSSELPLALDLLADPLLTARFLPEEVEEERRVVLDEIRKREAHAEGWAYEEAYRSAFCPDPVGGRIVGSVATVAGLSRDALLSFYRRWYRPDRAFLVLVGDFTRERALEEARRAFGGWKAVGPPPADPAPVSPAFGGYQENVIFRNGASPLLYLAATMPGYMHPDYLKARFLRELMEGWLTRTLVTDERVALATAVYFTTLSERSLMRIRITLARPEDAGRARDALLRFLGNLAHPEFPYGTVERVAENFRAREILVQENLPQLATLIGRAAVAGYFDGEGRPAHLVAPECYTRIRQADMYRMAARYLTAANLRCLFLLPTGAPVPPAPRSLPGPARGGGLELPAKLERVPPKDWSPSGGGEPPRDSDATRVPLPSGAVLIHLERNSAPVVAGSVILPYGSVNDPPDQPGLAALTLETLYLATEGYEGHELRWRLFEMGESYSVGTGPDVSQIAFTVPRENAREALIIVRKMLEQPAFAGWALDEARGRLLRKVRLRKDRIAPFAGAAFRRAALGAGAYAHSQYGTEESLARITVDDVRRFHREHYRRSRLTVALVGDLPPRQARAIAAEAFDGEPADAPVPEAGVLTAPPSAKPLHLTHPSGRGYVILGGRAPSVSEPLHAESSLLRTVLAWQVFVEFTDVRSTAYEAGAFYDADARAGALGLYVGTEPGLVKEAEKVLSEFLDRAATGELAGDLVADAKSAWIGSADLGSMLAVRVATRLAVYEAIGLPYGTKDRLRERIAELTAADLARTCASLFPPERRVRVVVAP